MKSPAALPAPSYTAPAPLADFGQRVMRRSAQTASIGIGMKLRLHEGSEGHLHHRLGNTGDHGGNAQNPCAARLLPDFGLLDGRGKVTPQG